MIKVGTLDIPRPPVSLNKKNTKKTVWTHICLCHIICTVAHLFQAIPQFPLPSDTRWHWWLLLVVSLQFHFFNHYFSRLPHSLLNYLWRLHYDRVITHSLLNYLWRLHYNRVITHSLLNYLWRLHYNRVTNFELKLGARYKIIKTQPLDPCSPSHPLHPRKEDGTEEENNHFELITA